MVSGARLFAAISVLDVLVTCAADNNLAECKTSVAGWGD